jgi:pyruvate dehydrogenase E1 component alpha subunit
MAELLGRVTRTSKGMGGSMHIFSKEHRFMVVTELRTNPVGGLAFADKYFETGAVTLTYFGDGAARQGSLHEALTWQCYGITSRFIVENNGYDGNFCRKNCKPYGYGNGLGYEMPCGPVDGMNPVKVAEAMTESY